MPLFSIGGGLIEVRSPIVESLPGDESIFNEPTTLIL